LSAAQFDLEALKAVLYSAVLSDVLDDFGYARQALPPFVRPLDDSLKLMGYARTGLFANTYAVREGENPYEIEIALIDDLKPNDVAVLGCDGPTTRIAPWGEVLTTASRKRGAVGCVTDGLCATSVTSANSPSQSSMAASARSIRVAAAR
jgi:4-hydroxy-4-methyl-2-oxoglutarate aldolase